MVYFFFLPVNRCHQGFGFWNDVQRCNHCCVPMVSWWPLNLLNYFSSITLICDVGPFFATTKAHLWGGRAANELQSSKKTVGTKSHFIMECETILNISLTVISMSLQDLRQRRIQRTQNATFTLYASSWLVQTTQRSTNEAPFLPEPELPYLLPDIFLHCDGIVYCHVRVLQSSQVTTAVSTFATNVNVAQISAVTR